MRRNEGEKTFGGKYDAAETDRIFPEGCLYISEQGVSGLSQGRYGIILRDWKVVPRKGEGVKVRRRERSNMAMENTTLSDDADVILFPKVGFSWKLGRKASCGCIADHTE